ncbi:MAG: hypothetical protein KDB71_14905 [Mycobacterium sp.]|nr:hypothetical protein [Mycobacterium sp.]
MNNWRWIRRNDAHVPDTTSDRVVAGVGRPEPESSKPPGLAAVARAGTVAAAALAFAAAALVFASGVSAAVLPKLLAAEVILVALTVTDRAAAGAESALAGPETFG